MTQRTPNFNLPYPEGTDVPDVPRDLKALADSLDSVIGSMFKVHWAEAPYLLAGHQNCVWKNPHASYTFNKFNSGTPGWSADGLTVPESGLYLIGGVVGMGSSTVSVAAAHLTHGVGGTVVMQGRNGDAHTMSVPFTPNVRQLNANEKLQVTIRPIGTAAGTVVVRRAYVYALKLSPTVIMPSQPTTDDGGMAE